MMDNVQNLAENPRKNHGVVVAGHFVRDYGYFGNRSTGDTAWFITLTLDGLGCFRIDGSNVLCCRGDVMILSPGTPQHYFTAKDSTWNFMWAHFLPPAHWDTTLHLLQNKQGYCHIQLGQPDCFQDVKHAFDRVYKYRQNAISLSLNGLEEMLLRFVYYEDSLRKNLDPRIKKLMDYLAEHLSESHTVESLANVVHLSISRLCHLFKEQTGETMMEALIKMRLHQALRLLEATTMNISEIANKVGFQSPHYFTSRFTSYYGTSPSVYRKQLKV